MENEELKNNEELRENVSLTEEPQKAKDQNSDSDKMYWGMNEKTYILVMHVAQFAGCLIPLLGFIAPIVMWYNGKDQSAEIDKHGKNIVNFIISWLIYYAVAFVLTFVVIGIFVFIALGIMQIIFVILAAIKASKGEYWKYPLTLTLVK